MPGPESLTTISSRCGDSSSNNEVDLAITGVAEGVAGDLRSGGGQADLVLVVEAKQCRKFAGALPCLHDVAFGARGDSENRFGHDATALTTTTLASSRWRRKSRNSAAPMTAGCRAINPEYADKSQRVCRPSECMIMNASGDQSL